MLIRIKDTGSHAINYQGGNSQQQTVLDNDQLSSDWASYFPAPADGAYDRINDAFSGNGTGSVLELFAPGSLLYFFKYTSTPFNQAITGISVVTLSIPRGFKTIKSKTESRRNNGR